MEEKILKTIEKLLRNNFLIEYNEEISIESNLIQHHDIDPIVILEFVLTLEDEFEITIPDADIGKIANIKECVDYLINVKNVKL